MLSALVLLTGCATSRSTLEIAAPKSSYSAPTGGQEVYINAVVDKREFEANPKTPNIPSVDTS